RLRGPPPGGRRGARRRRPGRPRAVGGRQRGRTGGPRAAARRGAPAALHHGQPAPAGRGVRVGGAVVSEVGEVGPARPVGRTDPEAGGAAPGTGEVTAPAGDEQGPAPGAGLDPRRRRLLVAGLAAVVALPL